jgi:hypothetical protein
MNALERANYETNLAYTERNRLVVLLAQLALSKGWKAGRHWDRDAELNWENVVMIDLPTGQVSWHIGVDDCGVCGFDLLPTYKGKWNGHTTQQKWDSVYNLVKLFAEFGGFPKEV